MASDREQYDTLPPSEKDAMGFAEYKRLGRIGTHGPDCWQYGYTHYECALRRISELSAQVGDGGQA